MPDVDGAGLVDLLAAGDPRGLAEAYDAYADRLFTYSVSLPHDRDAAADVVHDTLLIARERVGQLRDPQRLLPWLYAIARNECLRTLRDRRRTAGLDEATEVTDDAPELEAALRADELRELVWSAAASLNPGEREVLDLSVRHGLEGADLADALGVSANHAAALLSRARTQLERALSALVLARTGRDDCPELDALLVDWDGRLTPLLRKRLVRHLERCATCGEQRRLRISGAALLAGVPFLIVPPALRRRVLRDGGELRPVADWQALTARAGPWRPDGFPRPFGERRRRMIGLWAVAAAVAVVVLLVLGLVMLPGPTPTPVAGQPLGSIGFGPATVDSPTSTPTPTPTPTPIGTSRADTPAPTAVLSLATSPLVGTTVPTTTMPTTPAPATTTATPPPTTPPPPPPPTPTISTRWALSSRDCGRANTWGAAFYADVTGPQPQQVMARWYSDPAKPVDLPMSYRQGTLWSVVATGLPTNTAMTWYAIATTVDGVVASSARKPLEYDCPPG